MVWGCMSRRGVGQVYRNESTMWQDQYVRMLRKHMLPSASSLYGEGEALVFQQDNAPCHKANKVTIFLERSHVEVMQWPAQSQDLKPIEYLWKVLFRKVERSKTGSLEALWQLLPAAWQANPVDTVQNLVHSMPKRCAAVIASKGHCTQY